LRLGWEAISVLVQVFLFVCNFVDDDPSRAI
jgi:hypothetical protein